MAASSTSSMHGTDKSNSSMPTSSPMPPAPRQSDSSSSASKNSLQNQIRLGRRRFRVHGPVRADLRRAQHRTSSPPACAPKIQWHRRVRQTRFQIGYLLLQRLHCRYHHLHPLRNGKAVDKYNTFMPHKKLGGLTPMQHIQNIKVESYFA